MYCITVSMLTPLSIDHMHASFACSFSEALLTTSNAINVEGHAASLALAKTGHANSLVSLPFW